MGGFWESLSLPWQACLEEAWTAYCSGSIPIGAAITDADGRIVSRGRNRSAEPRSRDGLVSGAVLAHAELNALIVLDTQQHDPHTCIVYSTTEPCPLCMGAIYMSGVRQCYYASRDPYAGSANLLGTTPYLSRKPVRMYAPARPELELAVMAVFVEYSGPNYGERAHAVLKEIGKVAPPAVAVGEWMYWDRMLRRLRSEGCQAAQVWEEIVALLSAAS